MYLVSTCWRSPLVVMLDDSVFGLSLLSVNWTEYMVHGKNWLPIKKITSRLIKIWLYFFLCFLKFYNLFFFPFLFLIVLSFFPVYLNPRWPILIYQGYWRVMKFNLLYVYLSKFFIRFEINTYIIRILWWKSLKYTGLFVLRRDNNRRRVLKKNPLKNPRVMNHLNPYSKVMRKAAQNVEAIRKAARQAKLDAKRGVCISILKL